MRNSVKFQIRVATVSDVSVLYDLLFEMFEDIYGAENVSALQATVGDSIISAVERNHAFVAEENGKVVAFITLNTSFEFDSTQGLYIEDFCVTKAKRNKGYGSLLLKMVLQYAKGLGLSPVYLHVEQTNTQAKDFYTKFGFSIVKTDKSRYLMKKSL